MEHQMPVQNGKTKAQKISAVLMALCAVVLALFMTAPALAASPTLGSPDTRSSSDKASDFAQDGYANKIMSGNEKNRGGWDDTIFNNVGANVAGNTFEDTSASFVAKWQGLSTGMATVLFAFAFVLAVARFAGRGLLALGVFSGQKEQFNRDERSLLISFVMTGKERKDGAIYEEWVADMLKETVIYFLAFTAVWVLLGAIASMVLLILQNVMSADPSLGTFSIGEVNVSTYVPASGNDHANAALLAVVGVYMRKRFFHYTF